MFNFRFGRNSPIKWVLRDLIILLHFYNKEKKCGSNLRWPQFKSAKMAAILVSLCCTFLISFTFPSIELRWASSFSRIARYLKRYCTLMLDIALSAPTVQHSVECLKHFGWTAGVCRTIVTSDVRHSDSGCMTFCCCCWHVWNVFFSHVLEFDWLLHVV